MWGVTNVVILDRIEPGKEPDYCVHGRATCMACDEWVWLGSKTVTIVASGEAKPLCSQCAGRAFGDGTDWTKVKELRDHRRSDGPHDDTGELFDKVPADQWIDLPALGARMRKWPT